MDTAKVYFDSEGAECSIWQMVKREPTWAAVRIQEGEKAIDEITALRQQLAKSEARVAELTHSRQIEKTSMLMRVSRLSETLEAIRSGEFSLPKCQQLADRALGSPVTEAAILRLQAEAVEAFAKDEGMSWPATLARGLAGAAKQYAQRLRQQADEAERAGGEK
jgi:hypothetical protein